MPFQSFEEFQKANDEGLKAAARECFDTAKQGAAGFNLLGVTSMLEAQFYMQELDRRSDSWIARRDFWLEVAVIALILFEIGLGIYSTKLAIKQGVDEDALMNKQNMILSNLQQSTSDTAIAMKGLADASKVMGDNTSASAKTLLSLRSTTQEMNKGVQYQITLFYDPAISLLYDSGQNRATFQNTGRSGVTLLELYIDGTKREIGGPRLISGGTGYYIDFTEHYKQFTAQLTNGSLKSVPIEAQFQNELGKRYAFSGFLLFVMKDNVVTVHSQTASLKPEN